MDRFQSVLNCTSEEKNARGVDQVMSNQSKPDKVTITHVKSWYAWNKLINMLKLIIDHNGERSRNYNHNLATKTFRSKKKYKMLHVSIIVNNHVYSSIVHVQIHLKFNTYTFYTH
jgi:hypothetical protein